MISLPKVELHVHIEGTFSPERIARLTSEADEDPPRALDRLFDVDNLADFLDTLDWVCGLVRSAEEASALAYDFAAYLDGQGGIYAEVICNPTHWAGLRYDELLTALAEGFERAHQDGLADCRLLPSILRQQSAKESLALVEWMSNAGVDRIVGLSIDGNEAAAGRTGSRFAPAYERARALGFGCTAHAGESSGPEGVIDALNLLGVTRIDHGIRCVEDPDVLRRIVDEGVTLNVCPTSNCTLVYGSLDKHPLGELDNAGVRLTINTDDPFMLDITLTSEIELAANHLGWSADRLRTMTSHAIDAAFCSDADKAALRRAMNQPSGM